MTLMLNMGNVFIESQDALNRVWIDQGTLTINSDTPANDLPSLLGITTPATDADLLVFQALVADASDSASSASDSASQTQALFDDFDTSVAGSLAVVSDIDWDVEVNFNEGLEIKKGYGERDENGNRAVSFSRGSAALSLGKSGVYEEISEGVPAISNGGLSLYGGATNLIVDSEDFSSNSWVGLDVTLSDGVDIFGIQSTLAMAQSSTKNIFQTISVNSEEEKYSASFLAKKNTSNRLYCGVYNTTSSSWIIDANSNYIDLSDGIEKEVELNFTKPEGTTQLRLYVFRSIESANAFDVYVTAAQVTNTTGAVPYIRTQSSPVSRSGDLAYIPSLGNFPTYPTSSGFSSIVDVADINYDYERSLFVWSLPSMFLKKQAVGVIYENRLIFFMDDGTSDLSRYLPFPDQEMHNVRIGVTIDFKTKAMKAYLNGDLVGEISYSGSPEIDFSKNFYIGGSSTGSPINSEIKNYKSINRTLSDEEMMALGGVKK